MQTSITVNMLPDLLACAALVTLAIYHLMIYWGRRQDAGEIYNLYFSIFVIGAMLFIVAPYLQPQYFLYAIKPSWLYVVNVEALMSVCLFLSGIKFLNLLLKVPANLQRYFYFTYVTIPFNFLLTLTINFIGPGFYFTYILPIVLFISVVNVLMIFSVYGIWVYRQQLYKESFYRILYFGFVALNVNILAYRTIELLTIPNILVINHYISAIILYIFAYALSVKFNREYFELKDLKESLEKKVEERTEALEKMAGELSAINQARSRFFTGISHEFRTPLTLIIGPLENLVKRVSDQQTKDEGELMLRQSRRLLTLVNQLLELSKLQKGVQKLEVTHDNCSLLVETILDAHRTLAKELGIEIIFIGEHGIFTWFDKDKLEKIVSNLLVNALKFSNPGSKVEIELNTVEETAVELKIRDNGIGIAPEHLQNVFDPFYQVDTVVEPRFEGTGIGLSLVKELVELHRGTIRVYSKTGEGTEFVVALPALEQSYAVNEIITTEIPTVIPQEISEVEFEVTSNKLVLLVEDNVDMRQYIRSNLPSTLNVIEATNGRDGFDKTVEAMPDLIIADVMMPILDGLEMTRMIKQDRRVSHIPVILLTAKASTENKLEGLATNADDYITKPFSSAELNLRVRNMLLNRELLREKFGKSITVNPTELVTTSLDEQFLRKALLIVENNMSESEMSTEKFCEEIAMSRAHVHRKLKALTGQSASHFIRSIKLKRAAQLLRQNAGSVSEIAYQTGFNNLSYFTKCFKEQYGEVPSEYVDGK